MRTSKKRAALVLAVERLANVVPNGDLLLATDHNQLFTNAAAELEQLCADLRRAREELAEALDLCRRLEHAFCWGDSLNCKLALEVRALLASQSPPAARSAEAQRSALGWAPLSNEQCDEQLDANLDDVAPAAPLAEAGKVKP